MELIFLGTSSMVPTKERNHSSILLLYEDEGILFDCGEGTQRQLRFAGIKPTRITKIFITHWHGDHVLGLPGLIQTLGSSEYSRVLKIYGPSGTKQRFAAMLEAFAFEEKIELDIFEIESGVVFEDERFYVETMPLEHSIETLGYNFIEKPRRKIRVDLIKNLGIPEGPILGKLQNNKSIEWKGKTVTPEEATFLEGGKKITFLTDTVLTDNCIKLAKEADLLVCEATYLSTMEEKAEKYKHMTAKQAAFIANRANVKKLVLTHFSQRYKTTLEVEEDARDNFNNIICAEDFMRIKI